MKKLRFFLIFSTLVLLMAGCKKDDETLSFDTFIVNAPTFTSDSKSYLDFTAALSRILYEDGDIVYVNGAPFTLTFDADHNYWKATGTAQQSADRFYCVHADGAVSGSGTPTYTVNFDGSLATTTGITLVGNTTSNILTFNPAFAVLVFTNADINEYTDIRVGFDADKVPLVFDVSADDGSFSNVSCIPAANSAAVNNTMLKMHKLSNYYYIAVPIRGSSVTTKLYLQYTRNGDTQQRITSGELTLVKGKVYIIPSEDMSGYAFDEDGVGKGVFSVGVSTTVKFSAGNLQCVPHVGQRQWRIAQHQYDVVGAGDNQSLASNYAGWIDLFGYGTSGYLYRSQLYSAFQPFASSTTASDYIAYDLSGSHWRADWGLQNSGNINYGLVASGVEWRVLTHDEWVYLLNTRDYASQKRGGATVNGVSGLVILPDAWTLPTGLTFSNGSAYTSNTYSIAQWDKMEKAGAIFLPINGRRQGTTLVDNSYGYYWSSSASPTEGKSYCLYFTNALRNPNFQCERYYGCAVRLVTDNY